MVIRHRRQSGKIWRDPRLQAARSVYDRVRRNGRFTSAGVEVCVQSLDPMIFSDAAPLHQPAHGNPAAGLRRWRYLMAFGMDEDGHERRACAMLQQTPSVERSGVIHLSAASC